MGDFMKKGLYFSFNLKNASVIVFSAILIASVLTGIHYSTLSVATAKIKPGEITVIIDAGHGGADGGAQSETGILEKDINLSIANKLGYILSALGYKVIYTREDDEIPYGSNCITIRQKKVWDIQNRMKIMNEHPNSIFISIHQNFFSQEKYKGAQVFYSPNHAESRLIAECIQNTIVSNLQRDNYRQISQSVKDIYLLQNASVPAVMVECGFLSNNEEARLLADDAYQSEIALSVAEGIIRYLNDKTYV